MTCSECGKFYIRRGGKGWHGWGCRTRTKAGKTRCDSIIYDEKSLKEFFGEALGLERFDERMFDDMVSRVSISPGGEFGIKEK